MVVESDKALLAEIKTVVENVVHSGDISQLTERTVREAVVSQLGVRLGTDAKRTKRLVRETLNSVLENLPSQNSEKQTETPQKPEEALKDSTDTPKQPEDASAPPSNSSKKPADEGPKRSPADHVVAVPTSAVTDVKVVSSGNSTDAEKGKGKTATPVPAETQSRPGKRPRKRVIDSDESADEHVSEQGGASSSKKAKVGEEEKNPNSYEDPTSNGKEAAPSGSKKKKKSTQEESSDEEYIAEKAYSSEDEKPKPVTVQRRKRKRAPAGAQKTSKSTAKNDREQARLTKYLKAARAIGWPVSPSQLRNKSVTEKCQAVIAFLAEKGFDVLNASNLRKEALAAFRRKVDQQKELASLDASNIIADTDGRPRRRRSASRQINYADPDERDIDEDGPPPSEEEQNKKEDDSEGYVGSGGSEED